MKYLFLFGWLGLVIIGCLFYPQVNEDTNSSCAALEKQIIRVNTENEVGSAFTALLLGGISQGQIARKLIKSRYPNLPPLWKSYGLEATPILLDMWRIVREHSSIKVLGSTWFVPACPYMASTRRSVEDLLHCLLSCH